MKLGFVSRVNPKSSQNHVILGVMGYKPRKFAAQINLGLSNGWGVVRTIVDLIKGISDDDDSDKKYMLVKDPNKSVIRLYDVPLNTFEDDEVGMTEMTEVNVDGDEE